MDLFASSGGAVNALALVARHPEQVRILVAHEPPTAQVLPDREAALAAAADIQRDVPAQRLRAGDGEVHHTRQPQGPDPGRTSPTSPHPIRPMFGLPTEDDGSRNDPLLGQNIVTCTHYQPDFDALRAASTRIVIAAGAESGESWPPCGRGHRRTARHEPVTFPSDHGGFLGGEYGQTGEPEAFAATLREVLRA